MGRKSMHLPLPARIAPKQSDLSDALRKGPLIMPTIGTTNMATIQGRRRQGRWVSVTVLVLTAMGVVHASAAQERQLAKPLPVISTDSRAPAQSFGTSMRPLPHPVDEMHAALLAAAQAGNLEDLREPLEWNEMMPETTAGADEHPIDHWRKTSADGSGHEILRVLASILELPPAELPLGKDIENNIIYVWPYLAEADLANLTATQASDLERLVGAEKAQAMRTDKKWSWWRLTIGADGTWHSFKKTH
ncbi:hypothetical protein [Hyphomicrobium sulfonivorans]|uniref:hypothetical protein n=1 Tax=Hyphomicrobium sulfonivorans TaxID=121290 RepID=UPI0018E168C4|nr:hypothetical protein [Hyphomicrobium sulfonivorans]